MRSFPLRIYLFAFLVRLLPVLFSFDLPIGLDDMFQYDMLARSIVAGDGYRWYAEPDLHLVEQYIEFDYVAEDYDPRGILASHRAPLFPAFLALIYFFSGLEHRFFIARLVQAAFTALLAPLTYALGLRLFPGQPRLARFASVSTALYPMLVVFPLALATENLFIVLALTALVVLLRAAERHVMRDYLLAGLLLGLATLTRSVVVVFLPFAMAWAWFHARDRKGALVLLLCVLALTLPWAVRNTLLHGRLTYVESAMGYNLYLGYHPEGSGRFEYGLSLDLLTILDDGERNAVGLQKALGFIRDDPGRVPWLVLRKLGGFFGLERRALTYFYTNNLVGYIPPPWLQLIFLGFVLPFVVLSLLAAVGLPFLRWDKQRLLLAFFMVSYLLPHLLILAEPRFHLAWIPMLAVLAGYTWVNKAEIWARARTPGGRAAALIAVLLVSMLLFNWGLELIRDADKLTLMFGPEGHLARFSY